MKVTSLRIGRSKAPAAILISTSRDSPGWICWSVGQLALVQPQLVWHLVSVIGSVPVLASFTVPTPLLLTATVPRSRVSGSSLSVDGPAGGGSPGGWITGGLGSAV